MVAGKTILEICIGSEVFTLLRLPSDGVNSKCVFSKDFIMQSDAIYGRKVAVERSAQKESPLHDFRSSDTSVKRRPCFLFFFTSVHNQSLDSVIKLDLGSILHKVPSKPYGDSEDINSPPADIS